MRLTLAAPGGSWYASGDRATRDPSPDLDHPSPRRSRTRTRPPPPRRECWGLGQSPRTIHTGGCCASEPAGQPASVAETGAGSSPEGPEHARPATAGHPDQVKKSEQLTRWLSTDGPRHAGRCAPVLMPSFWTGVGHGADARCHRAWASNHAQRTVRRCCRHPLRQWPARHKKINLSPPAQE
ncbi:hypothetical protein EYS09_14540 [Streptomyces kasugaensis]|uniref:Uncharacterized protein n=1 Tax=Streptomyces kasugaensis TaxID=1946 RepID=A0A4Q9HWQ2_STRKA|nr:hypothetical protein EYS09_14540 [Streptomyces kasugaensis]